MNPCIPHHKVVMVLHLNCLRVRYFSAMFTLSHSSTNQELFKKYVCNQSSHYEKIRLCRVPQLLSETEVSIALICLLCSTCYIVIQIKDCLKSTSETKVATMKNMDNFHCTKEAIGMQTSNWCFSQSAKMNGIQRRTLVSSWRMHRMYCGMPKGTSRVKATLNSEKIKPIALSIIELR